MYEQQLEDAIFAAKKAAEVILSIYQTPFEVEIKADDSPVTKADKAADALIREILGEKYPEYGFLTEESQDTKERLTKKAIWIVDPVDGTKEFVSRNGQFTTNIALCVDHEIVAGVIHVPTLGITYAAIKGEGSYRIEKDGSKVRLHVSDRVSKLRAMRSISFFQEKEQAFFASHKEHFEEEMEMVGAALKFGRIAEGNADFFYRGSPFTKEWDVASGDLILTEAGGVMVDLNGKKLRYNREDVYNRDGYVLANKKENLFLD